MASPTALRSKAERIENRDSRWLKRFRAALRGERSASEPLLGLEGVRLVADALRSRLPVEAVLVSESGERHLPRLKSLLPDGVRMLRTSDRLFEGVADTEAPQGLAVLVEPPAWRWDDLVGTATLLVVLAGVQDPGNVGTIVRSAEAFGATGVVACKGCAHPFTPKAIRASAGSVLRLPCLTGVPPDQALKELRERGPRQYAATLSGDCAPQEADFTPPCAVWIGSEGAGLPPEIEAGADVRLHISLRKPVESLNAAVAAAVLLYEAARQRGEAGQ